MTAATVQVEAIEGRPSDGLPMPRRGWAIVALSFGTALLVMDNTIATVALPTVARALDVPASAAVSVVTVYQMVLLMALLPLSSLGDLIGNRRLYQGGQALFLVATVLCFFVNSLPMLLMTRAAQALGVAAVLSVNVGLLRRIYPIRHLGRGLALSSLIIASAGALAPTIGGYILSVGSWRWVFVAAAPFALISLLLGRALPAPRRRPRPAMTWPGPCCAPPPSEPWSRRWNWPPSARPAPWPPACWWWGSASAGASCGAS
ncbi:MFS transporter [Brevundimonas vesicularis]|uniref:MFS transporter n=1 Tax=Brevundimonas vesicularis TaxID=41276 RepID=UPI0038D4512D